MNLVILTSRDLMSLINETESHKISAILLHGIKNYYINNNLFILDVPWDYLAHPFK